jgi:carboxymethylenebutenolidase
MKNIFLTRRKFLAVSSLTAGFAIAVQPISAKVITTDRKGIIAGEVKIPVKDGTIPAYRARPTFGKDFPVILANKRKPRALTVLR